MFNTYILAYRLLSLVTTDVMLKVHIISTYKSLEKNLLSVFSKMYQIFFLAYSGQKYFALLQWQRWPAVRVTGKDVREW